MSNDEKEDKDLFGDPITKKKLRAAKPVSETKVSNVSAPPVTSAQRARAYLWRLATEGAHDGAVKIVGTGLCGWRGYGGRPARSVAIRLDWENKNRDWRMDDNSGAGEEMRRELRTAFLDYCRREKVEHEIIADHIRNGAWTSQTDEGSGWRDTTAESLARTQRIIDDMDALIAKIESEPPTSS